ncbi:MAG: NAD(P)/FAD-dependent oxidoreductase, partial [Acutalibacteraceae bacterium]
MYSVWSDTSDLSGAGRKKLGLKTDVLVIGGGLAGILCAYKLQSAGVSYILCEADTVCSKNTANTTAKITSQHGLIYSGLVKKYGVEKAKMYIDANENAVKEFRKICENTDCDFEDKNSYVYSKDNLKKLENELSALEKIGYNAGYVKTVPLPFETAGAVCFYNQAQFNPLKFVRNIAKDLNICEHTRVLEIKGNVAVTNKGVINAERIIVATHFPFMNLHGMYFIKQYQHRSYVIAYENAADVSGMYVDEKQNGKSFRNYKNLLLIGGGDHRTGKKGGCWEEISDFAKIHYPAAKEKYRWAAQDCMTLDSVPYIGRYSANTPNIYVATGFNKWGMTSSMVAADILTDFVTEKENPYAPVFD